MSLAEHLIDSLVEGVSVRKRKGSKMDSYGWSYNIPDIVWELRGIPHDPGVEFVWFSDFEGEGPALGVAVGASGGGSARGRARSSSEAESLVKLCISSINKAIGTSSATTEDQMERILYSALDRVPGIEMS